MDEKVLVAAAMDGDREAFNQLVIAYQGLAYNVAYRILGDAEAAADATQEAFISAYRGLSRLRGNSFKAWLLRIVTNACYDHLRRRKRRPAVSLDATMEGDGGGWSRADDEPPDDYLERQELGALLQRGLETLPPNQRAVVVLSDIHGMHYNEIAEALGISLGTVKSRLSRGRRKLRDFLLEHSELLPTRYRLHSGAGGTVGRGSLLDAVWLWMDG